jgi:hypothetical protein
MVGWEERRAILYRFITGQRVGVDAEEVGEEAEVGVLDAAVVVGRHWPPSMRSFAEKRSKYASLAEQYGYAQLGIRGTWTRVYK